MLALARLYLTVDDLDSCQQQCVQLLKMDSENDAATVVSVFIDVPGSVPVNGMEASTRTTSTPIAAVQNQFVFYNY